MSATISEADADAQTEAVKTIMVEQKLDFGPAYDFYIKNKAFDHAFPEGHLPGPNDAVDMSGWDAA
jgi:hypothetical protein